MGRHKKAGIWAIVALQNGKKAFKLIDNHGRADLGPEQVARWLLYN
jgi:hypothetical protein